MPVEGLDIGFRTPYTGSVHLIGALGELRDSHYLAGLHWRDRHLQLERGQKTLRDSTHFARPGPRRPLSIQLRTLAVFLGGPDAIESPDMVEEFGDVLRPRRQRQRPPPPEAPHLRFSAFLWIVVHEDEAVEPQPRVPQTRTRGWHSSSPN